MYYTSNKLIALTFLLIIASTMACAQAIPDATIINSTTHYDVQADGRYTVEERSSLRIDTSQAVKRFGQLPLPYSSTLQKLDVLEAYVIDKDGKRTDVPKDRIMEQQTPQSADAPMFDDGKVKIIIFPGVEVGSVLHYHTRKSQIKPQFPGHFSMVEATPGIFNIESAVITVKAPATVKLYVDTVKMKDGIHQTDEQGIQHWRWEIKDFKALPLEQGSVAPQDVGSRVAVTTFASNQEAAKAYLDRALPKAAATPDIKKLANEITKGITDRREQADAIYRWVSANIRYVAIFLDVGGVVPHAADEIAKARYGDCKDHTTLLAALLAAKGISSTPVLVNADVRFWNPKVAAIPGVFNHAILQVPEFDVYLDSTTQFASFGTLAMPLRGKPALIAEGDNQAKMVTLPLAKPEQDQIHIVMKLEVDSDGTVIGKADNEGKGLYGLLSRTIINSLPPGVESQVVASTLTRSGQNGTGSFTRGNLNDLTSPHRYSAEFTLPNYVQLPSPGAFVVPRGFSSDGSIAATFGQLGLEQRTLPVPLHGRRVEETITLQFPEKIKPTGLPGGTQLKWKYGSYTSQVKTEGSIVTINRVLTLDMPEPLLQPEDYPKLRDFGEAVIQDLRAQVIY